MWDHDSIQFALGVERYDLAAHHPHPPGYPLYIALLKLLAACGVDSLHGMVALSILAEGIGAGLMVLLVARLVASAERTGREEEKLQGKRALERGSRPASSPRRSMSSIPFSGSMASCRWSTPSRAG